jgi:hypothetical protein
LNKSDRSSLILILYSCDQLLCFFYQKILCPIDISKKRQSRDNGNMDSVRFGLNLNFKMQDRISLLTDDLIPDNKELKVFPI